ncbi:MAG TPA: hypothetical protein DCQ83_07335 [Fibrobacteres bacterium]|nr:hypothetical protein [Fibrobacterota bacterium]
MIRPYAVAFWNFLVCLILGPFALWTRKAGFLPLLVLAHLALWTVPLRWEYIVGLYLVFGATSFWLYLPRSRNAALPFMGAEEEPAPLGQALVLSVLVVYPVLFAYGLIRNIEALKAFSIHLPSSVYSEAFSFTGIYGAPAVLVLAFLFRFARLKLGVPVMLRVYCAILVMIIWVVIWEHVHDYALSLAGIRSAEILLFDVYREITFRSIMYGVFYGAGLLLGVAYLVTATDVRRFVQRALFLAAPTALGYSNYLLGLGDSGYFLASARDYLYREGRYAAWRTVAEIEAIRLPNALHVPGLMLELSDQAALHGDESEAAHLRENVLEASAGKPYFSLLAARAEWEKTQMSRKPACRTSDSLQWLPVPRMKPAVTLDGNWYGLLGAVAFFHPEWSDFDLKKRLLEISPDIRLSVPELRGLPSVVEALDIFGLPFSACFLDSLRIHKALQQEKIPFINFEGRWISLTGWDPCRRVYLYHRYPDSLQRNPWFGASDEETVFGNRNGKSFGGIAERPWNLATFLPEQEVLQHLHDIGGVALVLGDSNFASPEERRAAYLVEYGDVLYQDQDDNERAAQAYAKAQALFPSDYILARMAYIERRAVWSEGPDYGLDAIFRADLRRRSLPTGLNPEDRRRISLRILDGGMGRYLLSNWHDAAPRFFMKGDSAVRDSSRAIFRTLLRLDPNQPPLFDSLAVGFEADGRWDSAAACYRKEIAYYPLGNEYAAFRLAWTLFKQERYDELNFWLKRSSAFANESQHLLLQGVVDWNAGHKSRAIEAVHKSLQLDKTLTEAHAWMERMVAGQGDSAAVALHRRWRERTAP